ncbi:MAG: dTDP-4-dehydrorhamnose reductase [Desulfobulbaceae bacterium]|nr:dTDP-4-dehydrorhamnose reductase [Desulfobulbaceae bacterium]
MNIVITGAGGQLGLDCRQILENHTLQPLTSKQLDITGEKEVRKVLLAAKPDVVINCAAYTAVDKCEKEQQRCFAVNALGPGILAARCESLGCRLIHISTDYVFDGNKPVPEPYTENDPTSPLSHYGESKLAGENGIRERLENHLIIRTAWLYGMGGGNFLKTILRLAVNDTERILRVVNDQYGSLTWSRRLARQIERLLDSDLKGTIHATAEGYCTWFEGAKRFLEAMQVEFSLEPCTTAEYPTPAHRPTNSILENSRLKEEGLNVMLPWQEDMDRFARQCRETGAQ